MYEPARTCVVDAAAGVVLGDLDPASAVAVPDDLTLASAAVEQAGDLDPASAAVEQAGDLGLAGADILQFLALL